MASSASGFRLIRLLGHPWLALVFRLYLGGLFVYASFYKISYPIEFANAIAGYRLVPYWLVGFMAVALPWLELFCGLMLILGVRAKAAALLICAMTAMFTVAVIVNVLRGATMGCGCFSTLEDPMSWTTVLRDLSWLAMGVHVFFFDRVLQLDRMFFAQLHKALDLSPDTIDA